MVSRSIMSQCYVVIIKAVCRIAPGRAAVVVMLAASTYRKLRSIVHKRRGMVPTGWSEVGGLGGRKREGVRRGRSTTPSRRHWSRRRLREAQGGVSRGWWARDRCSGRAGRAADGRVEALLNEDLFVEAFDVLDAVGARAGEPRSPTRCPSSSRPPPLRTPGRSFNDSGSAGDSIVARWRASGLVDRVGGLMVDIGKGRWWWG